MDKAHGKDMLGIKNALAVWEELEALGKALSLVFESGGQENDLDPAGFERLGKLRELLEQGICEDPAISLGEGNLIRERYSAELDQLRLLRDKGRQLLEEYLEEEKAASGISSLKIRYNRLIGYFFEVTKAHLSRVPAHFIRRQGIVGGERFSTERLASLESDINGASDKIVELEKKLFLEIRDRAKEELRFLAAAARRVAELDAAQSLAKAASIHGWVRPELDESGALEIFEGRHPVVEAHLNRGEFIPNDIILNSGGGVSFALITGPNMAGKSTYLRSAALITLMAQTGSFVPASKARIGICDRIYCRVGASDNLARGESTFLVEMNETAYILNTATEKSLVIMDEVGRGTGTNDGLSIAWAVSEELLNRVCCRTLFATHYHELSLIVHPRMANRSMEVLDRDGKIIFLRKLREGPAAESYGLHVARLAGLSESVLERAERIMDRLRDRDSNLRETLPLGEIAQNSGHVFVNKSIIQVNDKKSLIQEQKTSFETEKTRGVGRKNAGTTMFSVYKVNRDSNNINHNTILEELEKLDPCSITPLDALKLLSEWKLRLSRRLEDSGVPADDDRLSNPCKGKEPEKGTLSLFD